MFAHTSTLYDVPEQSLIQITSAPSSCYLFSCRAIQEVVWAMISNKATDEEGFQAKFFKHGLEEGVDTQIV
jgi:hypothetical protein